MVSSPHVSTPLAASGRGIDRAYALDWYRRNRARTQALFDVLAPGTLYAQPIALRHPIVFYLGHLPGFSLNTLVKRGLGRPGIDAQLERLFARGIDPDDQGHDRSAFTWPDQETVEHFVQEADARVIDALAHADLDQPGHPLLDRAEAVYAILEHEAMHQETLLYMWHQLPLDQKRRPPAYSPLVEGTVPAQAWIDIPAGQATLGADDAALPFGWDNERPHYREDVAAFAIQRHDVTNADFLEFVKNGGPQPVFWERTGDTWYWRGMFDRIPLPASTPCTAFVSVMEGCSKACAYCIVPITRGTSVSGPNTESRRPVWNSGV